MRSLWRTLTPWMIPHKERRQRCFLHQQKDLCGHSELSAVQVLPEIKSSGTLILDFLVSRIIEEIKIIAVQATQVLIVLTIA